MMCVRRSGSERLVATEEPPRQAVIEMPDEMPDEKVIVYLTNAGCMPDSVQVNIQQPYQMICGDCALHTRKTAFLRAELRVRGSVLHLYECRPHMAV